MDFYQYGRTFIEDFRDAVAGVFEDEGVETAEVNYIDAILPAGFILLDELMDYQEHHVSVQEQTIETFHGLAHDVSTTYKLMLHMMAETLGVPSEGDTPMAHLFASLIHERLNDYREWMDEFDGLYDAKAELDMLGDFGAVLLARLYPVASEFQVDRHQHISQELGHTFLEYLSQAKGYIETWYHSRKE